MWVMSPLLHLLLVDEKYKKTVNFLFRWSLVFENIDKKNSDFEVPKFWKKYTCTQDAY